MWESRRDFQGVWEGWEAGFLAFHAFHTPSFPWPAFRPGDVSLAATSTSAIGRIREEAFVVIVVDECFGDVAGINRAAQSLTHLCVSLIASRQSWGLSVSEQDSGGQFTPAVPQVRLSR